MKAKRIEKDIFINTGKIKIVSFFSIWNLELVVWNLFEI